MAEDIDRCCRHDHGFHIFAAAVPAQREAHNVTPEITLTKSRLKRWVRLGAIAFTDHPRPQIQISATNGTWWYDLRTRDRTRGVSHWVMRGTE